MNLSLYFNSYENSDDKLYYDLKNSGPIVELLYESLYFNTINDFETRMVDDVKHFSFNLVSKDDIKYKVSGYCDINGKIKNIYYSIQNMFGDYKYFLDRTTAGTDKIFLNELILIDSEKKEIEIESVSLTNVDDDTFFNLRYDNDFYRLYRKDEIDIIDLYYAAMCEDIGFDRK